MSPDDDLLRQFRQHQRARNLTESTINTRAKLHRSWLAWLQTHDLGLLDVDRQHFTDFLDSRRLAARSRYHYINHLDVLYDWLVDENFLIDNPMRRLARPKVPDRAPRPIATEDLAIAYMTATARVRAFLVLAAYEGMRAKEIAGLQAEDVLVEQMLLLVTNPKGHRERLLPLHPQVLHALRVHGLPRKGFVFPYWNDHLRHIKPETVSVIVNEHLHGLGIDATLHQARHWFGTAAYRASLDLRLVQNLMGHRSPETTAGYAAYAPGSAATVVAALDFTDVLTSAHG